MTLPARMWRCWIKPDWNRMNRMDGKRAAEAMYVPYDAQRGIHLQDEDFLHKKPWDLNALPPENFPLLLHYHPLVIYRASGHQAGGHGSSPCFC